jgi:hypothetical protein
MLGLVRGVKYIFEPDAPAKYPGSPYLPSIEELRELPVWWISPEDQARFSYLGKALYEHTLWIAHTMVQTSEATLLVKIPQTERLPLLLDAYQPERVLYLRRHPLGVLNSYDEKGLHKAWLQNEWQLFIEQAPELFPELGSMVRDATNYCEQIVLMVHARNILADRILPENKTIFLEYERLCLQPYEEFRKLVERLGWDFEASLWTKMKTMVEPEEPAGSRGGLFETRKRSELRAYAWRRELAPHLLGRASRFIQVHGLPYATPGNGLPVRTISEVIWSLKMYRWRRAAYLREWGWSETRKWL